MTRFELKKQMMTNALKTGEKIAYTLCFVNPIFNAIEVAPMSELMGNEIPLVVLFYDNDEISRILELVSLPDNMMAARLSLKESMELLTDTKGVYVYLIDEEQIRRGENLEVLYDMAEGARGPLVYLVNTAKNITVPLFKKVQVELSSSPFVKVFQEEQAVIGEDWGKKFEDKQSTREQKVTKRILAEFLENVKVTENRYNEIQDDIIFKIKQNANKTQGLGE